MGHERRRQAAGRRYGVAMALAVVAGVFVGTRLPSAVAWLAPLVYLICLGFGVRWLVLTSRRPPSVRPDHEDCVRRTEPGGKPVLPAREILGWEFEYARTTASEATNDRQVLVNYYLAFAGALPTAVVLLIVEGPGLQRLPEYSLFGVWALWALVIVGWIFFLKIVRLRQAWYNSVEAMNAIKEFCLDHAVGLRREELAPAFLWQPDTMPKPEKAWNVFFLSAILIAFLNSLSFVMGSALLSLHPDIPGSTSAPFPLLLLFGLGMFALHLTAYNGLLKDPRGGPRSMSSPPNHADRPDKRVDVIDQTREYDNFLKIDRVRLRFERFDGSMSQPIVRYTVDRGDAVAVLAYDPAKQAVLLVQQFRYPAYVRNGPGWLWEIVAGVQDKGRDRATVAQAEMMEEAGYELEGMTQIGAFYPSPGSLTERVFLFLGYIKGGRRAGAGGGLSSENEDIALKLFPLTDALKMAESGEICDAKTIIALQWLALHKNNLPRLTKA